MPTQRSPLLTRGWRPDARADRDHRRAVQLGTELRHWREHGHDLPLLIIESHFSLLAGVHSPACWGEALEALTDGMDGPWAVLADRGDVMGLPQAIDSWGSARVGVGVQFPLGTPDGDTTTALLLAQDQTSYGRIATLCSWRHERPRAWSLFGNGSGCPLDWRGLTVLIRDHDWALRLLDLGAAVHWWSGRRPSQVPADLIARKVQAVAAPILRWLTPEDRQVDPVLRAIAGGTTVGEHSDQDDLLHACLSDLPTMHQAYAGFADQWLAGRELLAHSAIHAGHDPDAPTWLVPPAPDLSQDADQALKELVEAGIAKRYGPDNSSVPLEQVYDRLDYELTIIRQTGFAGYILTVWDLAKGRRTCGRGSGASSIVCYLLELTNVCPITYNLLFERFLMPERRDPPDIDIDFPWDERNEVIHAALHRYGRERAGLVSTHQSMNRWSALREAARAHGLDDRRITTMRKNLSESEKFGTPVRLDEPWPAVLNAAEALIGNPRHLGLHCGGVVITAQAIRELVPIHPAAKQIDGEHLAAVAWEKDGVEQMGLVKSDLLGNRSLAVIRDAVNDLADDGVTIPARTWQHPDTDPTTATLVSRGATMGCFYIESPATRQLQQKAGCGSFDRLVVHSSIIRPAAATYIDRYLERLHDFKQHGINRPEWYVHPAMRNMLSESFGVMSYQEDVMLVCREIAGFNDHEANQMRKALGSWGPTNTKRLDRLKQQFYAGCADRAIADEVVNEVWSMIHSFTGYSFCKAHSASYAMVSFQCAYLKAHHPAHFLARVIANQGGFYGPAAYLEEARRLGIDLLPPCVLHADHLTRRENDQAIRIGFQLVQGLGARAAQQIVSARQERPFRSLGDLRHRARLGAAELHALLDAGGLDTLLPTATPAQRAWLVAAVCNRTSRANKQGQASLDLLGTTGDDPRPPPLPPIPPLAVKQRQLAAIGTLVEHHPLLCHKLPYRRFRGCDLTPDLAGRQVRFIGVYVTSKPVMAHYTNDEDGQALPEGEERREAMSFVTLEDETALVETVWFPEAYRRFGPLLHRGRPLVVTGRIDAPFGCVNLQVDHVVCLQDRRRS